MSDMKRKSLTDPEVSLVLSGDFTDDDIASLECAGHAVTPHLARKSRDHERRLDAYDARWSRIQGALWVVGILWAIVTFVVPLATSIFFDKDVAKKKTKAYVCQEIESCPDVKRRRDSIRRLTRRQGRVIRKVYRLSRKERRGK